MNAEPSKARALAYMTEWECVGRHGVTGFVTFWQGKPGGWSAEPRPKDHRPGVVIVDVQTGGQFLAVGGTDDGGAERWETINPELESLRKIMEREEDVKRVVRLEPHGNRFRYLIETPFVTFPKFVVGTTDAAFTAVEIESRCGLLDTAETRWQEGPPLSLAEVGP